MCRCGCVYMMFMPECVRVSAYMYVHMTARARVCVCVCVCVCVYHQERGLSIVQNLLFSLEVKKLIKESP